MNQLTEDQMSVFCQLIGMIAFVSEWTDGDPATGDMIQRQVDRYFGDA